MESCLKETAALKLCMERTPEYYGPLLEIEENEKKEKEKMKNNEPPVGEESNQAAEAQ